MGVGVFVVELIVMVAKYEVVERSSCSLFATGRRDLPVGQIFFG